MDPRRALPSVDRVVDRLSGLPHALLVDAARDAIDAAREQVAGVRSPTPTPSYVTPRCASNAGAAPCSSPVINATGVLFHTNLGRAPIGDDAARGRGRRRGRRYSNLEYGLDAGGPRAHASEPRRRAAGPGVRRRGRTRGQQQRGRGAARAGGTRPRPRRRRVARRAGGDRRRLPGPRDHGRVRVRGSSRWARPTAPALADYERRARRRRPRCMLQGARVELPDGRVHRGDAGRVSSAALGPPVVVDAGSGLLDETTPWLPQRPAWLRDEPGVRQCPRRGRGAGDVLGRQAARRPAGGGHRRARRSGGDDRSAPTGPGGAGRQDHARRLAVGRARLPRRRRRRDPAVAHGDRVRRHRCATGPRRSHRRLDGAKVVDTEAVAGGGSLPGLDDPVGRRRDRGRRRRRFAGGTARARIVVARVADGAVVCDLRTVDPGDDATLLEALRAASRDAGA